MKKPIIFFFTIIFTACSTPNAQATITMTPQAVAASPTLVPTLTPEPALPAEMEELQKSFEGTPYALNWNEDKIAFVLTYTDPETDEKTEIEEITFDKTGTMTFTHEGQEFTVTTETLKINGQTFTFKTEDGKRWVFDGEKISEEIREFVPANTIEFTETLSNYDLKLAPDADLKGIYWDIAVSHLGDVISKSPGMEANRAIYEEIIKDHPEWEGISHSWDYDVRVAFMKEFLTRSGGRMIVTDMNWNKYEADFNKPVKFEVKQASELPKNYAGAFTLNESDDVGRGGGIAMYVDEQGVLVYSVIVVNDALDYTINREKASIYNIWKWSAGEIISDCFRRLVANTAMHSRVDNKTVAATNYKLYVKSTSPDSGSYNKNRTWTFIK